MIDEVLQHRGTTLVRRLRLEPGEATPWHRDPYHRVTVVLRGEGLAIEFRDGRAVHQSVVTAMDVAGRLGYRQINIATVHDGSQSR